MAREAPVLLSDRAWKAENSATVRSLGTKMLRRGGVVVGSGRGGYRRRYRCQGQWGRGRVFGRRAICQLRRVTLQQRLLR